MNDVSSIQPRVVQLELAIQELKSRLRDDEKKLADVYQKALMPPTPQGGGGASVLLAYTPSGGIAAATVTGTPPSLTITLHSASCWVYRLSKGTATYAGQFDVWNPYTSGPSTPIGASKLIVVEPDESGALVAIGEPC